MCNTQQCSIFVYQLKTNTLQPFRTTVNRQDMKKFNYYYNGQPITKSAFLNNVPDNWENEVDEYGEYSWGYYRASEIDVA